MHVSSNPHRGTGLDLGPDVPRPSVKATAPLELLARCPEYAPTPLTQALGMWIKDERARMGLGSFKALGAAYVIATHARDGDISGTTYVTASAGNHGMSVAAGARIFGANSVIYLARTVPSDFAQRLTAQGARVVVEGDDYEASMAGAMKAAQDNGWVLLSDSSWEGYVELPYRLMEGYLAMAAEITDEMPEAPTHIFLQAGVGGLAGACAAHFRNVWGDAPQIIVVEPEHAPALHASIAAGKFVTAQGPVSAMGRLDCKAASLIGLAGLSRDADHFALISEVEGAAILPALDEAGLASTPSGAAGIAAAQLMELPAQARVLCILSEQA